MKCEMGYETIIDDGIIETYYEETRPENTEYLHRTEKGVINSLTNLKFEKEKVEFKLSRVRNNKEMKKLIFRINRLNERENELIAWWELKFCIKQVNVQEEINLQQRIIDNRKRWWTYHIFEAKRKGINPKQLLWDKCITRAKDVDGVIKPCKFYGESGDDDRWKLTAEKIYRMTLATGIELKMFEETKSKKNILKKHLNTTDNQYQL